MTCAWLLPLVPVVLAIGTFMALSRAERFDVPPPPDDWGAHPDDRKWDHEALEQVHTGLDEVRTAADRWGNTVTAVLALFGTVTFLRGPETFAELGAPWNGVVATLVAEALVLAAASSVLAAIAAQGVPTWVPNLSGWSLKRVHKERERQSVRQLLWSRTLGITSATTLALTMSLAWAVDVPS